MKRNLLKCILWALLLAGCFPLLAVAGAQQKEQRYKIAVCDWMILKRQKIGSFQLVHELKGDGVELDMGGLGKREEEKRMRRKMGCRTLKCPTALSTQKRYL
jgi:L-ribulose-5-phosphate 3-epimerase